MGCTNIWGVDAFVESFQAGQHPGEDTPPTQQKNFHAPHNFHKVPILPLLHMVYMVLDNGMKQLMLSQFDFSFSSFCSPVTPRILEVKFDVGPPPQTSSPLIDD